MERTVLEEEFASGELALVETPQSKLTVRARHKMLISLNRWAKILSSLPLAL